MSARVCGAGPGVLLAHGAGSDIADSFGPVTELLARRFTVVAPDYPGSGATPEQPVPLDPDALTDQLVDAADRAGQRTFAVVGFSTGSPVAVRLAVRHPDRVSALVLSAGLAYANPRLRLVVDTWRTLLRSGDHRSLAAYLVLLGWSARWLDQRSAPSIAELTAAIPPALPPGTDAQLDLLSRIDVRADLAALRVPTLVIGATQDQVVSPAHADELVAGIPGARLLLLDSGHALAAEVPDDWAAAIGEFVLGVSSDQPGGSVGREPSVHEGRADQDHLPGR